MLAMACAPARAQDAGPEQLLPPDEQAAPEGGPPPADTEDSPISVVRLDPAQPLVDLTSVLARVSASEEVSIGTDTPLVLSGDEAETARAWLLFALSNPLDVPQSRIVAIERGAMWHAGIAPVRSGLTELGGWRTSPASAPLPQPVALAPRTEPASARFTITVPAKRTVTYAIPFGSVSPTPVYLWKADALAASDTGRAAFAGLVVGALAIAFAFFAARYAGARSEDRAPVGLAALLTGAALLYELVAQGVLAAATGWNPAWDARMAGATLALATGAAAHVLAAERIRALPPERERLARMAGWAAVGAALLALVLPGMGLPFVRMMAFAVALGGVAALAGVSLRESGPAAAELRAGWGLIAAAAFIAALTAAGIMPRSQLLELIAHALASLGVVTAAYALAGAPAEAPRARQPVAPAAPRPRARPDAAALRTDQRNALAIAAAGQAVWDLDVPSGTLYVDPSIEAHLGFVPGALCGRLETWLGRVHRDDRRDVSQVLDENVERGNGSFSLVMRLHHADEGTRRLELKASCFAGGDGTARRVIGTITEVGERRTETEGRTRESLHDPLTGLANRALFLDRLDRACRASGAGHMRVALILADLDRFKLVNESLGHATADTVLQAIARRLEALMAPEDTLARIDGDTFALLIEGWTEEAGPAEIAALVRDAISQPLEVSSREIFPTASIGFSVRETRHETGEELLSEADLALLRAKRSGDTIVRFAADMRPVGDALATESGLRRALERGEIVLAYQPIVALDTGRLAGFEALMRWRHPEKGEISPDDFVPLAEDTGMIIELGHFALESAASELAAWQRAYPSDPPLFVSVNVSSRQLLDDLPRQVSKVVEATAIPAASLRLEVTESLVMEKPDHAAAVLAAVRESGVRLALDDFGTGYSSLSHLKRFPFDVVKIDKSFVMGMSNDSEEGAIVRSVLSLAGDLKLAVVAEGVESLEASEKLAELGCGYGQGYHFGPPMEPSKAEAYIARHLKAGEQVESGEADPA